MKILYSDYFDKDLRQIYEYISAILQNKNAAEKLVDLVFGAIDRLKDNPWLGSELPLFFNVVEKPFRRMVIGSYVLVYRVEDDAVLINRLFYGRRNYVSLLFPDVEQ